MKDRLQWEDYFMNIVELISKRGTCNKTKFGAIIVNNNKIIGTGYNGSPRGMPHCLDVGCLEINNHCVKTIHAEQNALFQAGINAENSTLYCSAIPCPICFKLCIQVGIKKIIYKQNYKNTECDYWIKTEE